jgi:hypothetical protein
MRHSAVQRFGGWLAAALCRGTGGCNRGGEQEVEA